MYVSRCTYCSQITRAELEPRLSSRAPGQAQGRQQEARRAGNAGMPAARRPLAAARMPPRRPAAARARGRQRPPARSRFSRNAADPGHRAARHSTTTTRPRHDHCRTATASATTTARRPLRAQEFRDGAAQPRLPRCPRPAGSSSAWRRAAAPATAEDKIARGTVPVQEAHAGRAADGGGRRRRRRLTRSEAAAAGAAMPTPAPPLPLLLAAPVAGDAMQSRAVDTRVTLQVAEGVPVGTLVGAIPTQPGFTYRFNEAPREFSLDARSGAIRTAAELDREALRSDRYDLVVLSSQPTYPIEVRIGVLDVNDNAPAFPEPSIAVSFSESAAPGTRLLLDAASDADAGANGVSDDYRIVAGNRDDKFRLVVTESPAAAGELPYTYLHLETTARLDREQVACYQLNVSARDGGEPPRFGFLLVNVTVLDVNDNPPIFDHSDYTVSLNESAPPGTHVLQVTATDSDVGDNARIAYYLSDGERQFAVDAETGDITTAERLDCPQQSCASARPGGLGGCPKSCVFTVLARDHGSPRQDGRTYVTVNLLDANDHDPVIKFRYFPSTSGFATVDENAANGSVVAAVSVVDQDEGPNGETTVEIRAGNELGHFRLDCTPSFDIVRVHGVLDREQVNKYNLTVVAADRGSPPRTATAFLIVHVNDVNDHEPVFAKSEYSAVLSELAPAGSYVASIAAADEDSGVNARIYYALVSGNERGWFAIDEDSGLVTTRAPLDREAQDTAELRVSARDGGPNPKWAYTQLKVAILDENDERPRFSQERIEVSLPESAPAGTLVAMLTAEDADQGTNGSVAYELPRPADYPGAFSLDALTGQLMTRRALDREQRARYEVRVVARDRGVAAPALSASATVVLTVLDENDNSPAFYPAHYFAAVPQHLPAGATVLQVSASDRDEGANAELRFALEAGDAALFAVEPRSGAVTLRAPLPAPEDAGGGDDAGGGGPVWRLRVSARDGGGRRADPDATVELVSLARLAALEFDSAAGYHFEVAEDDGSEAAAPAAGGRVVGRVRVARAHQAGAAAVTYAVVAGDPEGSFAVDAASGVLSTRGPLDRERVARYSLRVLARAGLAAAEAVVNVTVLDLNDNAPEFPGAPAEVRLAENAAVGQEVCVCRARDRDAAANSRLAYSLARDPDGQFGVGAASGVVYLRRPVRAPPGTSLSVEVAATDGGQPPRTARHALSVLVVDVNDHTPVFDHTSYETSLLESTPVNERFFALAASDADLGANGQVRYAISDGDAAGRFGVFPDGWLYVRSALDREQRDYYSLLVTASDGGNPPRSSQVPVTVHVVDENDNAPQFANATFEFRVRENEPPDSFVGKLSASDRDVGRNAELTFALSGGADQRHFTVDPKNGFVKTLHVFDREQLVRDTGQSYVVLEATVTDNGAPPLGDRVKVYVHVADENDNAPRFLRTPYRVQVSEAAGVGTQVFRVFTADADEGANGQVWYSLAGGNEEGRFAVDAATGVVTVAAPLDRERAPAYRLLVEARDAAPDAAFSLAGGNRRDAFGVDAATGALYLHRPLDYEELAAYALNVTAADGGNPRLATTLLFRVDVEDSNDNPPAFPNTAIVRQIREGIPQRTPIVTVAAEDPDSGANGEVEYRIGAQEPPGPAHFGIDPATGVIHTLLPVDREAVDTFRLTVVATDRARPESARLSAEKLVTVIVEDVNDNAPQFVSMNAAVLPAAARLPPGDDVLVAVVRARDLDSATNGLVTYDLVSAEPAAGGDHFRLDRNSGALTVRRGAALPEPRYHLAVKASDEAVQAERKSSDAYLTVLAAPPAGPGAGAPRFEPAADAGGSVYENEPAGTSVLRVRAAVPGAPAAALEYYVTNVTWAGAARRQADRLFAVDARLGVLSTAAPLDREAGPPHYLVTVVAVVVAGAPPALATATTAKSAAPRRFSDFRVYLYRWSADCSRKLRTFSVDVSRVYIGSAVAAAASSYVW
ncbi:cadherin-related tumor suppressor-like [Schistocerca nitens]|uniref:cadherin-related tumor suppressor-like n=1 Tax=Schistocerca nitens TaxID=7011 RepID=UPI002119A806|nr:cadherin-related tumor suppressor-like [Schistocerca nitens]